MSTSNPENPVLSGKDKVSHLNRKKKKKKKNKRSRNKVIKEESQQHAEVLKVYTEPKKVKKKRKVENKDYQDNIIRRRKKKLNDEEVLGDCEESDDKTVKRKRKKCFKLENDDYKREKKKIKKTEVIKGECVEEKDNQQEKVRKGDEVKNKKRKRKVEDKRSRKKKKIKNVERKEKEKSENDGHTCRKKKKKSKKKEYMYDSSSKSEDKENNNISVCLEESTRSIKKSKKKKKAEKLENKEAFTSKRQELAVQKPVSVNKEEIGTKKMLQENDNPVYESDPMHIDWVVNKAVKEKFKMRKGKWTKEEVNIFEKNIEKYLIENNLDDPRKLIFAYLHTNKKERRKWREFARITNFYRKVAKDIRRPLIGIYQKLLLHFSKNLRVGNFSESEVSEMKRLVALYGRKWNKIGRMMQRRFKSVHHNFCLLNCNQGRWKNSEIDLLKQAVREETNTSEGEVLNINWNSVASFVKTRNLYQCRKKWIYGICSKDATTGQRTWGVMEDLKLIKKIYESPVTEEVDIDWHQLGKKLDVAFSPQFLHKKFDVMLKKYCSFIDLQNKDFEDIIDYLYNVKSKELQEKGFEHQ